MIARIVCASLLLVCAGCSSTRTCNTPRDCDPAQRCVQQECRDPASSPPGTVGDSCTASSQCAAGLSCADLAAGFPYGMCTADCAAGSCASGACATSALIGSKCAPTCTQESQCRSGYTCCALLGGVCVPSAACVPPSCKLPVVPSALPGPQVLDGGTHVVGDLVLFDVPNGTASVTIVHQARSATQTIVFQGILLDNSAVPGIIRNPVSTVYNDSADDPRLHASPDGGVEPSSLYAYYGGHTPITSAFTMPNTSYSLDAGVPAGRWEFVVNDYAYECSSPGSGCDAGASITNTYDISILLKPQATSANVDVAFYLVGALSPTPGGVPLNATSAPGDPSVIRMVSTLTSILGNAPTPIAVRNVAYYDVSPAERARFGTSVSADRLGPCDELSQMFTLSGAHPGNTLNVFLVQTIKQSDTGGGTVVGIDGTIPGPSSLNGTVHSGMAVSGADLYSGVANCTGGMKLSCGADRVAYIASHEAGHFLGLFHTTEAQGDFFDPLTDTLKCPCLSCASTTVPPGSPPGTLPDRDKCLNVPSGQSPPYLRAGNCNVPPGCAGGDNLMFWLLDSAVSQGHISSEQAQVMVRNPLVQP